MEPKPTNLLIKQATRWYARLRAPDCNPAERHEFQQWLESNIEHERAYEAAVRMADVIASQLTLDPRLRALAEEALKPVHGNSVQVGTGDGDSAEIADPAIAPSGENSGGAFKRHWRAAAVWLFSAGVAMTVASQWSRPAVQPVSATYENTGLQEQRIVLDDGSVLHLDVGAEVSVAMSEAHRELQLLKGRAYFEVAHDKSRPFSVDASGTRTVALGTRFEVDQHDSGITVTLAEGSVAVTPVPQTTLHSADAPATAMAWREILRPGQQLVIDAQLQRHETREVNADSISSWSSGKLVFDGVPLAKVLEQVNRYTTVKVNLGDASLASIPIGGNFVAGGDSSQFVEALSAVLPLRSIRAGANEIVLFQQYGNSSH